jgi:hypothetical protein
MEGEGKMSARRSAEKDEWRVKEANASIQEGVLKWSGGAGSAIITGRSGRGGDNECKEEC